MGDDQAADVGVGISGEEGLQAVNSSDYAIGQVGSFFFFCSWRPSSLLLEMRGGLTVLFFDCD